VPLAVARDNAFEVDIEPEARQAAHAGRPQVPRLGPQVDLRQLYRLDTILPRVGAARATTRRSWTDEVVGETATSLFADAQKMLDRIIEESG
jgi:5-methyltetrahydrofolate--homocysteine methyltransferase